MAALRNNASKTRGKPFVPGNPGRPKGVRHKATIMAEKLMQEEAREVVQVVLHAARQGEMTAARLVLERALEAVKS